MGKEVIYKFPKRRICKTLVVLCLVYFIPAFFQTHAAERINYDEGILRVQELNKAREYQKSEELLKEMLSQYPDNKELLNLLAKVFFWDKKYDESIEAYKKLLALQPSQEIEKELEKVYLSKELNAALEMQKDGRIRDAEEAFRKLYGSGRSKYDAGYYLGMLYIKERKYEEALRIFSEMKNLYPNDSGFEELYIESQILSGETKKAKDTLNNLAEERRASLYKSRDDLFYRVKRDYLAVKGAVYNYSNDIEDEREYTVQLRQRIAEMTFVVSYSNTRRFGMTDNRIGLDLYSKLGEKTKRWGYISLTAVPDADFLAKWTAGGAVYQGYKNLDFYVGYSHMEFNDSSVDRLTLGVIAYFNKAALNETLFINPKEGTFALLSKLNYEPNHKVNGFYSFSFGNSLEKIVAFKDAKKMSTFSHSIGAEYRFNEYMSIAAEYSFIHRKTSYDRQGVTLSAKYWW